MSVDAAHELPDNVLTVLLGICLSFVSAPFSFMEVNKTAPPPPPHDVYNNTEMTSTMFLKGTLKAGGVSQMPQT